MVNVELKQIYDSIFVDRIFVTNGDSKRCAGTVGKDGCGHDGPYRASLITPCTKQEITAIQAAIQKRDGVNADLPKPTPPTAPE